MSYTLMPLTNAPIQSNGWAGVACSADGTKLVAGAYGGGIYTSTNSGATWISNAAPAGKWRSIACSADGTKLAAVIYSGNGQIWTNSGTTWYPTTAPTSTFASYDSIACSADGTKLVAAAVIPPNHEVLTSPDSGTTWNIANVPNNLSWFAVASSADGMKLAVFAENTTNMYTSADSGATWVPHAVPNCNWFAVSSSADGTKLVAVALTGQIYTSGDSGVTWVSNSVPNNGWYSVASSADGSNIVAVGSASPPFYSSPDFGHTWISNSASALVLQSVACSTNGLKGITAGLTSPTNAMLYAFAPAVLTGPPLSLISFNSQLAVAWPSSVTGFQLQQNINLGTANWSNVTSAIVVSNGMNEVTISPSNAATFYRLKSQ